VEWTYKAHGIVDSLSGLDIFAHGLVDDLHGRTLAQISSRPSAFSWHTLHVILWFNASYALGLICSRPSWV
jgi:hypothetical protein